MDELLPCPFCGGDAEFERIGNSWQSCQVRCRNCGCSHESSDEGAECGTSWNRRAAPSEPKKPDAVSKYPTLQELHAEKMAAVDAAWWRYQAVKHHRQE